MTKPPSKSILSDDHINAIGRLVVAVSKIDSLLTDITAIFLQTDIWGTIIAVHHQQIASKLSTLESLIRQRLSAADAQGIWDVIKSAGDVAGFRNKIVHCHWTIDESGVVYAVRFQARGKFSRSRHQIDAVDIQQQADEADAIAGRLVGLQDHFLKTNTPNAFEIVIINHSIISWFVSFIHSAGRQAVPARQRLHDRESLSK